MVAGDHDGRHAWWRVGRRTGQGRGRALTAARSKSRNCSTSIARLVPTRPDHPRRSHRGRAGRRLVLPSPLGPTFGDRQTGDRPGADRRYLERVWLNRWTQGDAQAFDAKRWRSDLARAGATVPNGAAVSLGLDGSRWKDDGPSCSRGWSPGYRCRSGSGSRDFAEAFRSVVAVAVDEAFKRWSVTRLYGDPRRAGMTCLPASQASTATNGDLLLHRQPQPSADGLDVPRICRCDQGRRGHARRQWGLRSPHRCRATSRRPRMSDEDGTPGVMEKERHDSPNRSTSPWLAGCPVNAWTPWPKARARVNRLTSTCSEGCHGAHPEANRRDRQPAVFASGAAPPGIAKREDYFAGKHPLAFASPEWRKFHEPFLRLLGQLVWGRRARRAERTRCSACGSATTRTSSLPTRRSCGGTGCGSTARPQVGAKVPQGTATSTSYALVWGNADDEPVLTWETPSQAIVDYDVETGEARYALKSWTDDDGEYATLYTPTEVWKLKRAKSFAGQTALILRRRCPRRCWMAVGLSATSSRSSRTRSA